MKILVIPDAHPPPPPKKHEKPYLSPGSRTGALRLFYSELVFCGLLFVCYCSSIKIKFFEKVKVILCYLLINVYIYIYIYPRIYIYRYML